MLSEVQAVVAFASQRLSRACSRITVSASAALTPIERLSYHPSMPDPDALPLLNTEVHFFGSRFVGDELKLLVGRCGMSDGEPPVVLYLPDGDLIFGAAVNMLWGLRLEGYVPPMLIVGIGYRVQSEEDTFSPRSRDLTPSTDEALVKQTGWMSGGADRFLRFIKEELKPWVAGRYGVDPDDDAFFGDSFGALFGAHVLLTEPSTFKRYGLGSPSLFYDHHMIFGEEAAYAESNDDLDAKVYVSVGEYEGPMGDRLHRAWLPEDKRAEAEARAAADTAAFGEIDLVADVERLVATLRARNYPSLRLAHSILASEFHSTAATLNLSRSLRFLFGAPG